MRRPLPCVVRTGRTRFRVTHSDERASGPMSKIVVLASAILSVAWTPALWAVRPAPPDEPDSPVLGAAIGDAKLAPYFTTPALKSALSEYTAGRPESALRFLPARPREAS